MIIRTNLSMSKWSIYAIMNILWIKLYDNKISKFLAIEFWMILVTVDNYKSSQKAKLIKYNYFLLIFCNHNMK